MDEPVILVINPGSTSTKLAVYKGKAVQFTHTEEHPYDEIVRFPDVISQTDFRKGVVEKVLAKNGYTPEGIDIFVGRGGLLKPISGGVYAVNDAMIEELSEARNGEHPCNLGAILAHELSFRSEKREPAGTVKAPAYIVDPVVIDEFEPESRISGHPEIPRKSVFHALNQKMVAEKASIQLGKTYEESRLIVAHLGGGVSVGVHKRGRVVDVNNALEGDGPFSPERTGSLPLIDFYRYVTENGMDEPEIYTLVTKKGGLIAHLGTNDCREIEKRIAEGDEKAEVVYKGFILTVAKSIAAGSAVLAGNIDAVVLTGNVAKGKLFLKELKKRIGFIAPVLTFTDNSEMDALAFAAYDAYTGKKPVREY